MMEEEVVRRRQWLSPQEFLDLLAATNLIPGPNSTEMAIHIGNRRAGWPGLLIAGLSFILPAAAMVTAIGWAYVHFGKLPQMEGFLYGIKPVIIAIVLQALWGLGRTALKNSFLIVTGLAACVLNLVGVHELIVLVAAGIVMVCREWAREGWGRRFHVLVPVAFLKPPLAAITAAAAVPGSISAFGLWPLFLFFVKVGSVLFGSGYVLLAFLRGDLVDRFGWITQTQLLDAIAVGQITPGPVFTTATFIGYILAGAPGAGVATLGIFLPAFVFVAISGRLIPRLRSSRLAAAALDGVTVASLALMAVVTGQLSRAALTDVLTVALAIAAAVLLFRYKLNSVWLVLGGAAIGVLKVLV